MGPGKYDDLATYVRERTEAACVIVAVIDGNKGSGFSLQSVAVDLSPADLVAYLREMATQIEQSSTFS